MVRLPSNLTACFALFKLQLESQVIKSLIQQEKFSPQPLCVCLEAVISH